MDEYEYYGCSGVVFPTVYVQEGADDRIQIRSRSAYSTVRYIDPGSAGEYVATPEPKPPAGVLPDGATWGAGKIDLDL